MSALPEFNEVPNLRSEIDRKAFEQLERLSSQLEKGQINNAMFHVGVMTVWNCVSGLASEFITSTISEIRDMTTEAESIEVTTLVKEGGGNDVVTIGRHRKTGDILVNIVNASGHSAQARFSFADYPCPSREGLKKQDSMIQDFKAREYKVFEWSKP